MALGFALSLLPGCFLPSDEPPAPGSECGVAEDQRESFMPRIEWGGTVEVGVDQAFRDRDGLDSTVQAALSSWNAVGQRARGRDFFRAYVVNPERSRVLPKEEGSCDFEGSDRDTFHVLRDDDADHWEAMGLNDAVPGVTLRCYEQRVLSTEKTLTQQVVLLSPRVARKADPQLQQFIGVTLHEIGHALGLDHSCSDTGGNPRFAACNGLSRTHPYFQAVLYPFFGTVKANTAPEDLKQTLRKNDMDRAYCLYRGL